jgi:hypothetical protein
MDKTIQWPKEDGQDNTMDKVKTTKKDKQYNGQSKNHKEGHFDHCIVCPSLWFLL